MNASTLSSSMAWQADGRVRTIVDRQSLSSKQQLRRPDKITQPMRMTGLNTEAVAWLKVSGIGRPWQADGRALSISFSVSLVVVLVVCLSLSLALFSLSLDFYLVVLLALSVALYIYLYLGLSLSLSLFLSISLAVALSLSLRRSLSRSLSSL